jgi:hypothetical protein
VLSQETDVTALWNDTKIAYIAAHGLLQQSKRIERRSVSSYSELIEQLADFISRNEDELGKLESYACALAAKNELAPAILFSYSVWGSTRRADRTIDRQDCECDDERLQLAGELALGLRRRTWPTLYRVWLHAINDAGEAADPEDYLSVPVRELSQRAEFDVKRAIVEYFTEMHDSLRHIDTLGQEDRRREHIYANDVFITQLVGKISAAPNAIETELWDVKETLDMWS